MRQLKMVAKQHVATARNLTKTSAFHNAGPFKRVHVPQSLEHCTRELKRYDARTYDVGQCNWRNKSL